MEPAMNGELVSGNFLPWVLVAIASHTGAGAVQLKAPGAGWYS